jgi:hypothetical protein
MNEFLHRNEPEASVSPVGVRPVSPVPPSRSATDATKIAPRHQRDALDAPQVRVQSGDDVARAHAEYAKVQSEIETVLADLGTQSPRRPPAVLAQAENALLSLMPRPSVVLPLPPASQDMVAFVAQVTKSIAQQAAQTRAAQGGVSSATVDAAAA